MTVRKDVSEMISSWEKLNDGGGGGALSLEMPNDSGGGGGRRTSQDHRDLCRKFNEGKEERVMEDARPKSGKDPGVGNFASLVST